MFTNALLALAASGLVGQAVAAGAHHAHQHLHAKRDLVTEVVTVTEWTTVYATGTKEVQHWAPTRKPRTKTTTTTTSSSSSSAPPPPPPPPPPPAAVPTTLATQPKPAPTEPPAPAPEVPAPAPPSPPASAPAPPPPPPPPVVNAPATSAAPPPPPAPVTPPKNDVGSAGKPQRGLPYNHPELLPGFLGSGSKITWTYNWGQWDDSKIDREFVPMLWGDTKGFPDTWNAAAQKAIDGGSKCLLSFNEPDLAGQADMSPARAAEAHKRLMNPFASKARIGSPAITSSTSKNMGIDWMKQFFAACGGGCAVDFVVAHSYGHDGPGFLNHLVDVHNAFNKPVWVTEFAFPGSDDDVNKSLAFVINELETNPKYSFVERYAYFMAAQGSLVSGNGPSKYGNTFAYN